MKPVPDDDDDLLQCVSEAFDENLPPIPDHLLDAALALQSGADGQDGDDGEVTAGAEVGSSARQPAGVRPRHRIERHMAMAAAGSSRQLDRSFVNGDGTVTTTMAENDEGHLLLSVSSGDSEVVYVSLGWRLVGGQECRAMQMLVIPLASDRSGVSVSYDLGPAGSAEAVDVEPAEPMSVLDVDAGSIAAALDLPQTGSARRAWRRAAFTHQMLADPVATVIMDRLGP